MFLGENYHSLDAKGRFVVPAKLRGKLGSTFVITRDVRDPHLYIYPLSAWEDLTRKLGEIPSSDKKAVQAQRIIIGSAQDCEPDGQGRFLIPQNLRKYAKITKEIVSVGMTNRIELWAKEVWDENVDNLMVADDELMEELKARGI